MSSLLGHLSQKFSAISKSLEDVASESLAYILNCSKDARLKFGEVINSSCSCGDLIFSTQEAITGRGITDISGFDSNGRETLIVEAKFWASLTDNQPMGYLKRLRGESEMTNDRSCLLFVCPESRRQSIYNEVNKTLAANEAGYKPSHEHYAFLHEEHKITILIKSWSDILFPIRSVLEANLNRELISDIEQIIGLCKRIEDAAFLPFQKSDFSPEVARKICSCSDLADKVIEVLQAEQIVFETGSYSLSLEGLRATPQRCGYNRAFKINPFGFVLNVDYSRWTVEAGTFFWLSCSPIDQEAGKWTNPPEHQQKIKAIASELGVCTVTDYYGNLQLPLIPEYGEFDENKVAKKLAQQVVDIFRRLIQ